jgi:hypothetical protein
VPHMHRYRKSPLQLECEPPGEVSRPRLVTCHAAWIAVCVAFVLFVLAPSVSWAHTGPGPFLPSLQLAPAGPSAPVIIPSSGSLPQTLHLGPLLAALLLLVCVGFCGITWQWRRGAALSLTLIIGLFAFNTAIHSVHHFFQPQQRAKCPLFSTSQHATGTPADVDAVALGAPHLVAENAPVPASEAIPSRRFLRPAQERAPPLPLA